MTLTVPSPARAGSRFHAPAVFVPVVATTVAVTIVAAATSPPTWLTAAVAIGVIAVLGIPHGAVDHLVVERLDGRSDTAARRRFVGRYVLAMAGMALVWLASPPLALAGFLVLSAHHFGQSDLAHIDLGGRRQLALQWSRGAFLVGLPLIAHLPTVSPIVERLGAGDPTAWPWLADARWVWCALLISQHAAVLATVAPAIGDRRVVRREIVSSVVLAALFLAVDPLLGFAVYFGLWHSLAHLGVLADVVGGGDRPVRSLARAAAPLTVVSLVGLAAVTATATIAGRTDLVLPAVFVFVSMLTVPHAVVVVRLWRHRGVCS